MKKYKIKKLEPEIRNIVFIDIGRSSVNWFEDENKMENAIKQFSEIALSTANDFHFIEEETNFTGDGMLLSFSEKHTIEAVNCGWLIAFKWWQMGGHTLFIRVGINLGNIHILKLNDNFNLPFQKLLCGDTINRAARITDYPKKLHSNFDIMISEKVYCKILEINDKKYKNYMSSPYIFEFEKNKILSTKPENIYKLHHPIFINQNKPKYLEKVDKSNKLNTEALTIYQNNVNNKNDIFPEVEKLLKKSIEIFNSSHKYLNLIFRRNLGAIYLENEKPQDALEILEKIDKDIEKFKLESPHHKIILGDVYNILKMYNEALREYKIAQKRLPIDATNIDKTKDEIKVKINHCKFKLNIY